MPALFSAACPRRSEIAGRASPGIRSYLSPPLCNIAICAPGKCARHQERGTHLISRQGKMCLGKPKLAVGLFLGLLALSQAMEFELQTQMKCALH